jgi:class 3 adenylate cyclase
MTPAAKRQKVSSEVVTVMFTDIVGYTKQTAVLSREQFSRLLNIFDNLSLPVFEKYSGKVVKKIGDAFLVFFQSPTDAILCGIELQKAFRSYNLQFKPRIPLRIKVAIHTGEVIHRDNDIYGDAVNIASRIESAAEAGQVVFSEPVFSVMNKNEIPFVYLGLKRLKGAKYPLRIFRVMTQADLVRQRWDFITRVALRLVILGAVGLLIFFIAKFLLASPDIWAMLA